MSRTLTVKAARPLKNRDESRWWKIGSKVRIPWLVTYAMDVSMKDGEMGAAKEWGNSNIMSLHLLEPIVPEEDALYRINDLRHSSAAYLTLTASTVFLSYLFI